ncbi:hypothetical protein BKA69DRAFT_1040736 [Paraphysoderma sedebokerense]|nr:hypothetical protein BKA69DRAFT_1040736 [Paraphysoderma sedebokerense]
MDSNGNPKSPRKEKETPVSPGPLRNRRTSTAGLHNRTPYQRPDKGSSRPRRDQKRQAGEGLFSSIFGTVKNLLVSPWSKKTENGRATRRERSPDFDEPLNGHNIDFPKLSGRTNGLESSDRNVQPTASSGQDEPRQVSDSFDNRMKKGKSHVVDSNSISFKSLNGESSSNAREQFTLSTSQNASSRSLNLHNPIKSLYPPPTETSSLTPQLSGTTNETNLDGRGSMSQTTDIPSMQASRKRGWDSSPPKETHNKDSLFDWADSNYRGFSFKRPTLMDSTGKPMSPVGSLTSKNEAPGQLARRTFMDAKRKMLWGSDIRFSDKTPLASNLLVSDVSNAKSKSVLNNLGSVLSPFGEARRAPPARYTRQTRSSYLAVPIGPIPRKQTEKGKPVSRRASAISGAPYQLTSKPEKEKRKSSIDQETGKGTVPSVSFKSDLIAAESTNSTASSSALPVPIVRSETTSRAVVPTPSRSSLKAESHLLNRERSRRVNKGRFSALEEDLPPEPTEKQPYKSDAATSPIRQPSAQADSTPFKLPKPPVEKSKDSSTSPPKEFNIASAPPSVSSTPNSTTKAQTTQSSTSPVKPASGSSSFTFSSLPAVPSTEGKGTARFAFSSGFSFPATGTQSSKTEEAVPAKSTEASSTVSEKKENTESSQPNGFVASATSSVASTAFTPLVTSKTESPKKASESKPEIKKTPVPSFDFFKPPSFSQPSASASTFSFPSATTSATPSSQATQSASFSFSTTAQQPTTSVPSSTPTFSFGSSVSASTKPSSEVQQTPAPASQPKGANVTPTSSTGNDMMEIGTPTSAKESSPVRPSTGASFSFGAATSSAAAPPASAPAFSFPTQETAATPASSSGQAFSSQPVTTSQFSFGAPSILSAPKESSTSFGFQAPTSGPAPATANVFAFGSSSQPSASAPTSTMAFGSSKSGSEPQAQTNAPPAFSFGSSSSAQPAISFNFNPSAPGSSTGGIGGFGTDQNAKPSAPLAMNFNFGGGQSSAPTSDTFVFGGASSSAQSSQQTSGQSTPFVFGGAAPASTQTSVQASGQASPFVFGGSSSASQPSQQSSMGGFNTQPAPTASPAFGGPGSAFNSGPNSNASFGSQAPTPFAFGSQTQQPPSQPFGSQPVPAFGGSQLSQTPVQSPAIGFGSGPSTPFQFGQSPSVNPSPQVQPTGAGFAPSNFNFNLGASGAGAGSNNTTAASSSNNSPALFNMGSSGTGNANSQGRKIAVPRRRGNRR